MTDQYLIMYLSKTWDFILRIEKDIADFRKKTRKTTNLPSHLVLFPILQAFVLPCYKKRQNLIKVLTLSVIDSKQPDQISKFTSDIFTGRLYFNHLMYLVLTLFSLFVARKSSREKFGKRCRWGKL